MSGFNQFLLRANAVDMAVGIVVGAAFGTAVISFVKDLQTPVVDSARIGFDQSVEPALRPWVAASSS
jgi:large conductance mechanosensitive channel protein